MLKALLYNLKYVQILSPEIHLYYTHYNFVLLLTLIATNKWTVVVSTQFTVIATSKSVYIGNKI